jgi:formylglycine-generating enzyme required for sulfatase activity
LPRFVDDDRPDLLDNWQVRELRGLGVGCETWRGSDDAQPHLTPACLKFVTDPLYRDEFIQWQEHFLRVLDLEPVSGVVPLRSVYTLTDPPCLESPFVSGHDLTGLMRDWRWRYDSTRPGQAVMIIRRIARAVGALHRLDSPVVHRGLKPSNILIHPTAEGKASIWVADIGWGEISALYALRDTDVARARRQAVRGAYAPLYASPQQKAGAPPDPRDDIYALGVIWYQLLCRDPSSPPPEGNEWALEFRRDGLTDAQARLLASCLDPNAQRRPANALALADLIDANIGQVPADGSKTFVLKGSSTTMKALDSLPASRPRPVARHAEGSAGRRHIERESPFTNSIGMKFVLIPAGVFGMGSPDYEKGRREWEGPRHVVRVTRPFCLSVYPVTQAQYQQVTGKNPAFFHKDHGGGADHPVEQVSWDDAVAFCDRLTSLPVEAEFFRAYRLPTEAEWEFACRAGTNTPYSFGDIVTVNQAHFLAVNEPTWKREPSIAGRTARVGLFPSNPWGLYEMHGNVLEWCADWWGEDFYDESPEEDPTGPDDGWQRVVRGGSFNHPAADCRSAARLGRAPGARLNMIGFRVAMNLSE